VIVLKIATIIPYWKSGSTYISGCMRWRMRQDPSDIRPYEGMELRNWVWKINSHPCSETSSKA
jgi:hypothetical protein